MPAPTEHKTVQARILAYAEAGVGWTLVSRRETKQRRGFDLDAPPKNRTKGRSLYFDDLFDEAYRTTGGDLGKLPHVLSATAF